MIFAFYILAAILIYFSYRSYRGGIEYLEYFRGELVKPPCGYMPFATVIAPCKGLDEGLSENLTALFEQDYPRYEVIFVVDNESDAAVDTIKSLPHRREAKLIVAPKATESSQKVENLREAVLRASPESKVLVFVDSDARPSKNWLRHLVAPLENEKIGAATGYRWFISKRPGFASGLRSVWNASIASSLGPNVKSNFCWGGSTAIRREVFERLDIRERWRSVVSDDFTVTRTLNEAGLSIYFVPQALTATIENCSFRELLEFTTRQMKITRVYAPRLWLVSFFGSGLFNIVFAWSLMIILSGSQNNTAGWIAAATLVLVTVFSVGKSRLRLSAVKLGLPQYKNDLDRQLWAQYTLWTAAPAIFLINCVLALFSQRIRWRGVTYEMISATQTKIRNIDRTMV